MKIALFYGSTTGNTEDVAERIQLIMGAARVELLDVTEESINQAEAYEALILGIPTWDYGEIQSEWEDIWDEIDGVDLTGIKVAIFGLGDQIGYGEWFLDAMGLLHDKVVGQGAEIVGHWPVEGYDFEASKALTDDKTHFVGLALDEDSQHELTDERLSRWCQQVATEFGI